MIRARDWSGHPLGPPTTLAGGVPRGPVAGAQLAGIDDPGLGAGSPFLLQRHVFPLLGPRLPWAMGERFDEVWADGWAQAKPIIDAAMAGPARALHRSAVAARHRPGRAGHLVDLLVFAGARRGRAVAGLFILTNETTGRVLADAALTESRGRLETALADLRDLNASLALQVEERTADRNALWTLSSDMMLRCLFDGTITAVNPGLDGGAGLAGRRTRRHQPDRLRPPGRPGPHRRGRAAAGRGRAARPASTTATATGTAATAGSPGRPGPATG